MEESNIQQRKNFLGSFLFDASHRTVAPITLSSQTCIHTVSVIKLLHIFGLQHESEEKNLASSGSFPSCSTVDSQFVEKPSEPAHDALC